MPGANEWIWEAEMEGGEQITEGGTGRMRFDENGAISNFSYDEGASGLTFRPQDADEEGAAMVTLDIDYGEIGGLNGLTQFEGTGQLMGMADGYTAGSLVDFEIDQSGIIVGRFSNDTMRDIGRIAVAQFNNESGLMREANNTYAVSGNSGDPFTGGFGIGLISQPGDPLVVFQGPGGGAIGTSQAAGGGAGTILAFPWPPERRPQLARKSPG